jgi:hypothetical protein
MLNPMLMLIIKECLILQQHNTQPIKHPEPYKTKNVVLLKQLNVIITVKKKADRVCMCNPGVGSNTYEAPLYGNRPYKCQ